MKTIFKILMLTIALPVFSYEKELPQNKLQINENWSYYVYGCEKDVSKSALEKTTDLCFFSGDVDCYGEIPAFPKPNAFPEFKGRKHLVITAQGRTITHFVLDPSYGVQKQILKQIKNAAKDFDGVQIDFETIPSRDFKNFRIFLKKLRKTIGKDKILSVCVPARNKNIEDDMFDYKEMSKLADKIFVMAYDQHWASSAAGPVADLSWCKRIAEYAKSVIPPEKLVMGLPFYGRSWGNVNYSKAWFYSGLNRILKENNVTKINRNKDSKILDFSFKVQLTIKGFFDDAVSIHEKMKMYDSLGIKNMGFWRLGQEDQDVWNVFEVNALPE